MEKAHPEMMLPSAEVHRTVQHANQTNLLFRKKTEDLAVDGIQPNVELLKSQSGT